MAKKHRNLSGEKIASLFVIKEIENGRGTHYECLCDCGNHTTATSSQLIFDKKRSCGCARVGKRLDEDRKRVLLSRILNNLKTSGRSVCDELLNLEFLEFFITKPCFYCGREFSKKEIDYSKSSKKKLISELVIYHNGIDRVNSSIDYELNNIVPCCRICNTAKTVNSPDQFIEHSKRISIFNGFTIEDACGPTAYRPS